MVALHGQLQQVLCLQCKAQLSRADFQAELLRANPALDHGAVALLPDGDAELGDATIANFAVPACDRCGGVLKPNVVFFGDAVAKPTVTRCYDMVAAADALLIVGSSVMIFSSFRFCRAAQQAGIPLAALNIGKTRADEWLEFKLGESCGGALQQALDELGG